MKIISKYKDYYDSTRAYDTDDSIIYVRETKYVHRDKLSAVISKFRTERAYINDRGESFPFIDNLGVHRVLVGFCGKLYPAYEINHVHVGQSYGHNMFAYSNADISKSIDRMQEEIKRIERRPYAIGHGTGRIVKRLLNRGPSYCTFMDKFPQKIDDDIFRELNAPVFVIALDSRCSDGVLNPNLNKLEFFRVFDSFSCYQELSMYVGNILTQPDIAPQRVGSDEIIAKQKGFDEYSFRTTAPGTKKLNRRENRLRKRGIIL